MQIKIYIKTSKGTQALLDGSIGLDDRHVRVLGLLDGSRGPAQIAPLAKISEGEAADILQKLILIGYARSTAVHYDPPSPAPDTNETFGSDAGQSHSAPGDPIDVAALRRAAKERSGAPSPAGQMDLGSASDVWHQTQLIAQQVMNERLERERKEREAAERELRLAKEREIALEQARIAAEEALAQERAEQQERTRLATIALAAKQAADELEAAKARRLGVYRRRVRAIGAGACLAAIAAIALCVEATLGLDPERCGALLTKWAQAKSSAQSCSSSFLPSPHFEAKGILFGGIAVDRAEGDVSLLPLFIGKFEPANLSLSGVKLSINSASELLRMPSIQSLDRFKEVALEGVSLSVGNVSFPDLRGGANLAADGHVEQIQLRDQANSTKISFYIEKNNVKGSFQSRFSEAYPAPLPGLRDLSFDGSLRPDGLVIEDGSLTHASGYYSFTGEILWVNKKWSANLKFDSRMANLGDVSPWFFNTGRASLSGVARGEGATLQEALASSTAEADLSVADLSIKVDLAESLGASRGTGNSSFPQAEGKATLSGGSQSYAFPSLANGPLKASVKAGLGADGKVTGSASAALPERGLSSDSLISGTSMRMLLTPASAKP